MLNRLESLTLISVVAFLCAPAAQRIAAQTPHASLKALLKDPASLSSPTSLPLVPSVTSTVYRAEEGQWQFNLHSYLAWYKGRFWAIWSSGRVNEDSNGQIIRYATSRDGHHWEASRILADAPNDSSGQARWIARGIFVQGKKLEALAAYFEGTRQTPEGKESWHNLKLVRFEWDGNRWANRGTYIENCMNNFPPRPFGDHLFMTCRDSYARMHTAFSKTLAGGDWTVKPLPGEPPADRMSEPSWYVDPQGIGHLIFRDGRSSHYLFHSISRDEGKNWTAPVRTNYPDATSKNITGKLSNGWYFLINNPNQHSRDPLAISFSRDGWQFSQPKALRKNSAPRRFAGKSKPNGSFQYPHAMEHSGSLWVIYATNKEDIEISEFKLSDFGLR